MEKIKCCPKCNSKHFVKNGIVKGRQRYLCKHCGYRFTVSKLGKRIEKRLVIMALQLYLEGLGFRAIERILGISHVTIIHWVKTYGKNLEFIRLEKRNKKAKIVEIDELSTFIAKKKQKFGYGLVLIEEESVCWVSLLEIVQK